MRKSLFAFALSLALLLVPFGVKAQSHTPLNENFDGITSGLPTGWDNSDNDMTSSQATSYNWQYTSSGYQGTGCVWLQTYLISSGKYSALKTPALTLNSNGEYLLRFKYLNYNAGQLDVYVSTDGGTTYTTALATGLASTTNNVWTEAEYCIKDANNQWITGSNIKIVFKGTSNYGSYHMYIDDVVVTSAPTCQNPDGLYINSLSQSGATLNWGLDTRYGVTPDLYSVTLRDASGNLVSYNGNVAQYSTQYAFSGLTPNTTYVAWVRSNCDAQSYAGYSDSISVQFTTLPNAQSVPYFENFDARNDVNTGGFYNANAQISTANCITGVNGKSAQLVTTAANSAYLVFPLLNIAANNMEIDYYIKSSSSSLTINYIVGYLTDPSDIEGTFVPVVNDSVKSTNWINKRFNTGSLTDVTSPVMFCISVGSGNNASIYIDNVDIHTIPTCTRPEGLNITNYGSNDVTLDWSMANANNVRVYAMDPTDSTILATAMANAHPYQMTGLTPQTDYLFAVRGICSTSDSSEISTGVTVKTRCSVASVTTFQEGAEGTTGTALPACWETGHINKVTTSTVAPFATGTSYHHTGGRSFYLNDMTSGNIAYLISQKLDFGQTAGTYTFSYWIYRPSGTSYVGEGLKIFVTPTPGDTTNAVQVIPFVNRMAGNSPTGTTGWNQYEGIINYTGQGYIMIVGYSKWGSSTYFDDMEVKLTPTCPKISGLSAGNATQNTAEIYWTTGYNETQWIVDYQLKQGSTVITDTTGVVVTGQPKIDLTGLSTATTYTVSATVRAYCGVGDTAEAVSISNVNFTTQCGAITSFPYTMGFETNEDIYSNSYYYPMCWTLYNNATSSTYQIYPYAYTSYARTGSRCLYNSSYSSSTSYADTITYAMAAIDTTVQPINNLRIKFWTRNSSTSYSQPLYVGIMTNPNDPTTFVKVDSVTVSGTTYFENVINFSSYSGIGTYIAFGYYKATQTSTYSYICIDDVTVEPIPSCADLAGGLTVSSVSDTSATFSMTDQTATNWQYAYGLTGDPISGMTPVNATGSTLTLTGLAEATTYDIYVRRDCGNGDYGAWADVTTFSTTAVPARMPFVCGFEDTQENARWQYADGSGVNVFTIGTASTAIYAGTQAMYVTTDRTTAPYSYSNSSSSKTYAYRTMHFDAKGYQVEIKAKSTGGESYWDFGRIFLTTATEQLTGGTGTSYSSTTFPNMVAEFDQDFTYSNYKYLNSYTTSGKTDANGWVTISYFLDMSTRPGDYNLVLMWSNDGSGGSTPPMAVDNINIYELTCIPPSTLYIDSLSSNHVNINIQSNDSATQWEVAVSTTSFAKDAVPDSCFYRALVNGTPNWGVLSLDSLTPNTQYWYAVRTVCGANDTSAWSDVYNFTSHCAMVNVPLSEGFESQTSANCWINTGTTGSISRNTSYKHSASGSTASLKIVATSAASPELNVVTLAPDMLNGWCYATTDSVQFLVGVMTDPNESSTFMDLGTVTIPAKNTWTEFTTYFSLLNDPDYSDYQYAKYIVIATGTETIYFDDFIIDATPTCPKPTEVNITNIGAHQFDISFTDNAQTSSWVVTTNGTPHVITTNPATITGLNSATSYSVEIAAICSATDTSYYTNAGTITTSCDIVVAPYTESFEGFNAGTVANCWDNSGSTTTTVTSYPDRVWGVYSYGGNKMLRMYNYCVYSGYTEIISPTISVPAGNNYELKYSVSHRASCDDLYVYIKGRNDAAYVAIDTIAGPTDYDYDYSDPGTFTVHTRNISSYAGDTITLKFSAQADYGDGAIYIDDLSIKALLNCSDPNVPTVSNITASSADVQITDTCSAHNAWQYVYGPSGFDPTTATPVVVDSTGRFSISGLTDDTPYQVYVRANCGTADGFSNWVSASFRTLCAPFHVTSATPFNDDFNNYNYGVDLSQGTCFDILTQDPSTPIVYPTTDPSSSTSSYKYCYGHSTDPTDRAMYWNIRGYDDIVYQYVSYQGSIVRQFTLDADSTYEVSAWVRNDPSTSYSSNVSLVMGTATNNLDTLKTVTVTGATVSSQYIGSEYWYYYNTLYQQVKMIISPDSTGDYYIGFHGKNPTGFSYYSNYFWLDDWSIRAYSGCAPKVATIDTITTNSAHVTMSGAAYQFEYVLDDTTHTTTILDSTSFTITGLSAASNYTLYIRSYCDSANYSEWLSIPFTTACGAFTNFPYTQDFEGTFLPVCWSQASYGSPSNNWSSSTSLSHSGTHCAYIPDAQQGAKTALTTGELSLTSSNGYEVTLWVYRSSSYASYTNEGFHIYVSNTPVTSDAQAAAATEIAFIAQNYQNSPVETAVGWYEYTYAIPTALTGSRYVTVAYHNYYGTGGYIDDLTVAEIPACRGPKTAPSITGTTMTTLSARASMAGKDSIEFGIAPYSATVTSADITNVVGSNDGDCTFTGLTGSTHYAVWYRYVCDSVNTSAWSTAYAHMSTMSTDCFDPQSVHTVGVVNDHHAAITWGAAPSAVSYEYELYLGASAAGTRIDSAVTTQMPDTIVYDSLSGNTAYYFRVRGFCSGDTTNWVGVSIQTTYPCYALPFICNFEDATQNAGWQFNNLQSGGVNTFVIGSGVSNGGSNSLYISDDGSTHNYTATSTANADAEVLLEIPAGNYLVQYDWQAYGESCCDYGRVFLVPSSTNVTSSTITSVPSSAIKLYDDDKLNVQSSWQSVSKIVSIATDGVYKLVVGWHNDGSVGTQPPLAIDNIRIQEINCMPLTNVNNIALATHSAKFEVVRNSAGVDFEYGYSTIDSEDSITWTTVTGSGLKDTISLTGLAATTQYYLFARAICDSVNTSAATRVAFTTTSAGQPLPFICGFETNEATTSAWQYVNDTGKNEFVVGSGAAASGNRSMYISENGASWTYSNSTATVSYAYVPLEFGAGTYDIEYEWQAIGESGYDYARVYLAPTTFVPTAGTLATGISTTTTPTGWTCIDRGSQLNLAADWFSYSGEQTFADSTVVNFLVVWRNDGSVGTNPPIAIDNIRIAKQICTTMPSDSIGTDTIGEDMFTLHFYNPQDTAGARTKYIVSTSSSMNDTVAQGILADSVRTLTVNNLISGTYYYVFLYNLCDSVNSSKTTRFILRTECSTITQYPYTEGFENMDANTYNLLPGMCWATTQMSSSKYAVATQTTNYVHSGNQGLYVYNDYTSSNYQILALPEMDSLNGKTISFWHKAYSTTTSYNTLNFGYLDATNSFVSLNNFSQKVTDWQQYSWQIANLPAGVTRLAFKFTGAYYYYLDDIHINNVVPGLTYNDTICHNAAYSEHGFSFNPGQLHDGDTTFTSTIPATVLGVADSITTVNIHVRAAITNDQYDTICSGQPYNQGMWQIANPTTRTYFRTFTSVTTGCDSTVNLYLYVYPTSETINDTICQGQSYQFGDTTLTATGSYFRTITNKWGCAVTTTLNLLVEATADTTTAIICSGESYQFCGNTYTQSGTYNVNTTTTHGCTVVKTLHLTVMKSDSTMNNISFCKGGSVLVIDTVISVAGNYTLRRFTQTDPNDPQIGCYTNFHVTVSEDPILEGSVNDDVCEGHLYTGYGLSGVVITQDTTFDYNTHVTKGISQCDSVVHVTVKFNPTTYGSEDVTIAAGETYTWHDNSYNTTGTYVDVIPSETTGCDSVCTLNLTVGGGSGVDNVSDVNIDIVPNPVNAGATAFVYGNFGEVRTVEILNNFGQVIDQFEPKSYPIEVSGIAASGLYYVRVTTVDGQVHLQKLVVK